MPMTSRASLRNSVRRVYVERVQQFASQCGLVLSNADILHLEHRNSETLR